MERLTSKSVTKHADGKEEIVTYCHGHRYGPAAFPRKYGTSEPQEYKNYCEMIDRLVYYEDLEEQGLLINLPCKIGDTIFTIIDSVDKPYIRQDNVVSFEVWNKNKTMTLFIRTHYGMFEYNKKAFIIKESAEETLEKLQVINNMVS